MFIQARHADSVACIFDANERLIGQSVPLKVTRATASSLYGELVLSGVDTE